MFVVEVGSVLTTLLFVRLFSSPARSPGVHPPYLSLALGHRALCQFCRIGGGRQGQGPGRGASRPRAGTCRQKSSAQPERDAKTATVPSSQLRKGDFVLVEAGDIIPGDGEVVVGVASVNESAITGESAPVIRESGGDRSAVTGGTQVLSDWLVVRITANPGETFLDRMISMVEGAKRQKTPNEIALDILLAGMTIIFLLAVATLLPFSLFSVTAAGQGSRSLLLCSFRFLSASFRRRSAVFFPRSALPEWTGLSRPM